MNTLLDRQLILKLPKTLVFGCECSKQCIEDMLQHDFRSVMLITAEPLLPVVEPVVSDLKAKGFSVSVDAAINKEPTFEMYEKSLELSRSAGIDAVLGIGGGSVLDVAKLIAAMTYSEQSLEDVVGIGKLSGRKTYLACLPTTSGTGSEVSPNAILLDEKDQQKKGIISEHLVPDAVYVDPLLTRTVPPSVTVATGMDALVHCIEAYANRFAHPAIDLYALEGIRLISANLQAAYEDGENMQARSALSLGSMYGGLCLGPVNTGAVHALAYPLGGEFHIAHGISNAVLLPYVMEYNLPSAPERYAQIAEALGATRGKTELETARNGLDEIRSLSARCGLPARLSDLGITQDVLDKMAASALCVTRLLKNNLREISYEDALDIYREAL